MGGKKFVDVAGGRRHTLLVSEEVRLGEKIKSVFSVVLTLLLVATIAARRFGRRRGCCMLVGRTMGEFSGMVARFLECQSSSRRDRRPSEKDQ